MSEPKTKVEGEKVDLRMTDVEVAEYNRLVEASKQRALTFAEENRLHILSKRNILRTRVE